MGIKIRHPEEESLREIYEINVTPFVDVMLVLLIIFMVAAPLATVDVKVDLPASSISATPHPEKPIFVSIQADHGLFLNDEPVTEAELGQGIDHLTGGNKNRSIFIRADKTISYGLLMQTMNILHMDGYAQVGLVALDQNNMSKDQ